MLFGKRKRIVKRILIVEDEPLTAFDNEMMLGDAGYEVVATLDTFDDAIAMLDKQQIDLVLSDVRLSGERTGMDLARAAKDRGVPVLFSTGLDLPADAATLALGRLKKPYSERQLRSALEAVERMLAGKEPKLPKGLEIYRSGKAEPEAS
ncbi:response regulator [Sphingomonas sinipercae]|uniref:Response regulator n=1 Tax=Sphingomonas sinipercae TaxID=2714944 RepID=A0A6G7ZMU6_9SPHN|nr:response regulator [Sphingomonas sinipercae]QIL02301.1 response regulator [Sphingomonas sinipercae]